MVQEMTLVQTELSAAQALNAKLCESTFNNILAMVEFVPGLDADKRLVSELYNGIGLTTVVWANGEEGVCLT